MPLSALAGVAEHRTTLGRKTFRYAWSASSWSRHTVIHIPANTCRSLTASVVYSAPPGPEQIANKATLVSIQRHRIRTVNVTSGSIAHLKTPLSGQPTHLAVENAPGNAYGNGTASCWTRNGRPPKHKRKRRTRPTAHVRPAWTGVHAAEVSGFVWPANGTISTTAAEHKQSKENQYAEDIATNAANTPVVAAASGTVVASTLNITGPDCGSLAPGHPAGYGEVVVIEHAGGSTPYYTLYGHLASRSVVQGQKVSQGQTIGVMGATGCASGQHLHFEVGTCTNGQGLIPAACTTWGLDPNNPSHGMPVSQGASIGGNYPGLAVPAVPAPGQQFNGAIVQWDGDKKAQKTAWLVVPNGPGHFARKWIPDIQTYWCLKRNGAPGPIVLDAKTLSNVLPDLTRKWAPCDTRQPGQGHGGSAPAGSTEQAGHFGAPTFADHHTASGPGPRIPAGQYVSVVCKVQDGNVASVNPDGYWYQIAGDPWSGAYWAPANVFMNGDPWAGPYSHNTDTGVPDCGKSGAGDDPGVPPPTSIGTWLEQQGRRGASTFANYHNASDPGPALGAGQYVNVACKVHDPTITSTDPDGYWYRLSDAPWNDAYYAAANTFFNGDPVNGPYAHNTDFNVPDCAQPVDPGGPPPAGVTYTEQQGHHGVHTFTNVHNASGLGPDIPANSSVQVSCKVLDGTITSVNPDGYWYRVASTPWNDSYYAPANTFMNGDPPNGPYSHNTDFAVPDCGAGNNNPPPPPPSSWAEQEGHHGADTFSNYHNASGPGTRIDPMATVQVSCKVYDPTIQSANPDGYWYRIADAPWNNQFYAVANTFFNGDPVDGPYTHNTDFAVPNC